MRLILTEEVPKLGSIGSIVTVKGGYARNYLIPRALAVPANESNTKELEHKKRVLSARKEKFLAEMKALAGKIKKVSLTVSKKVGEGERIFGTVTTAEISDLLKGEGFSVDKKDLHFEEEVKKTGTYKVVVKLHSEVDADFKLKVVAEEE